jgi:hypothetical protein
MFGAERIAGMAIKSLVDVVLAEAETDCSAHTSRVKVVHRPAKPKTNRRPNIIAGLLRILAENTDGRCAFRGATDAKLITTGMIFSFTSDKKRDEFMTRIRLYLDDVVRDQLDVGKI